MSATQSSPDSSLRPDSPEHDGTSANGQEPGRQIDVAGEAAETETDALREAARLLERAPGPGRKRQHPPPVPAVPQLPPECIGIGCVLRTRIGLYADRCQEMRDCPAPGGADGGGNTGGERPATPPAT